MTEEDATSPRADTHVRAPWFDVPCCPPNVARTLAQLGTYVAAVGEQGLALVQYASGEISTSIRTHERLRVRVQTDYPNTGTVVIDILEAPPHWTLVLRIPSWASGSVLDYGGEKVEASAPAHQVLDARPGTRLVLTLPVQPRWTRADPRVDAVRGTLAVERGPLVLCAESVDLPSGMDMETLRLDPSVLPSTAGDGALVTCRRLDVPDDAPLYGPLGPPAVSAEAHQVPLIPYYRWANRGPSTMRVWLPTTP